MLSTHRQDFRVGDVVEDRHTNERGIVYRVVAGARLGLGITVIVWLVKKRILKTYAPQLLNIVQQATAATIAEVRSTVAASAKDLATLTKTQDISTGTPAAPPTSAVPPTAPPAPTTPTTKQRSSAKQPERAPKPTAPTAASIDLSRQQQRHSDELREFVKRHIKPDLGLSDADISNMTDAQLEEMLRDITSLCQLQQLDAEIDNIYKSAATTTKASAVSSARSSYLRREVETLYTRLNISPKLLAQGSGRKRLLETLRRQLGAPTAQPVEMRDRRLLIQLLTELDVLETEEQAEKARLLREAARQRVAAAERRSALRDLQRQYAMAGGKTLRDKLEQKYSAKLSTGVLKNSTTFSKLYGRLREFWRTRAKTVAVGHITGHKGRYAAEPTFIRPLTGEEAVNIVDRAIGRIGVPESAITPQLSPIAERVIQRMKERLGEAAFDIDYLTNSSVERIAYNALPGALGSVERDLYKAAGFLRNLSVGHFLVEGGAVAKQQLELFGSAGVGKLTGATVVRDAAGKIIRDASGKPVVRTATTSAEFVVDAITKLYERSNTTIAEIQATLRKTLGKDYAEFIISKVEQQTRAFNKVVGKSTEISVGQYREAVIAGLGREAGQALDAQARTVSQLAAQEIRQYMLTEAQTDEELFDAAHAADTDFGNDMEHFSSEAGLTVDSAEEFERAVEAVSSTVSPDYTKPGVEEAILHAAEVHKNEAVVLPELDNLVVRVSNVGAATKTNEFARATITPVESPQQLWAKLTVSSDKAFDERRSAAYLGVVRAAEISKLSDVAKARNQAKVAAAKSLAAVAADNLEEVAERISTEHQETLVLELQKYVRNYLKGKALQKGLDRDEVESNAMLLISQYAATQQPTSKEEALALARTAKIQHLDKWMQAALRRERDIDISEVSLEAAERLPDQKAAQEIASIAEATQARKAIAITDLLDNYTGTSTDILHEAIATLTGRLSSKELVEDIDSLTKLVVTASSVLFDPTNEQHLLLLSKELEKRSISKRLRLMQTLSLVRAKDKEKVERLRVRLLDSIKEAITHIPGADGAVPVAGEYPSTIFTTLSRKLLDTVISKGADISHTDIAKAIRAATAEYTKAFTTHQLAVDPFGALKELLADRPELDSILRLPSAELASKLRNPRFLQRKVAGGLREAAKNAVYNSQAAELRTVAKRVEALVDEATKNKEAFAKLTDLQLTDAIYAAITGKDTKLSADLSRKVQNAVEKAFLRSMHGKSPADIGKKQRDRIVEAVYKAFRADEDATTILGVDGKPIGTAYIEGLTEDDIIESVVSIMQGTAHRLGEEGIAEGALVEGRNIYIPVEQAGGLLEAVPDTPVVINPGESESVVKLRQLSKDNPLSRAASRQGQPPIIVAETEAGTYAINSNVRAAVGLSALRDLHPVGTPSTKLGEYSVLRVTAKGANSESIIIQPTRAVGRNAADRTKFWTDYARRFSEKSNIVVGLDIETYSGVPSAGTFERLGNVAIVRASQNKNEAPTVTTNLALDEWIRRQGATEQQHLQQDTTLAVQRILSPTDTRTFEEGNALVGKLTHELTERTARVDELKKQLAEARQRYESLSAQRQQKREELFDLLQERTVRRKMATAALDKQVAEIEAAIDRADSSISFANVEKARLQVVDIERAIGEEQKLLRNVHPNLARAQRQVARLSGVIDKRRRGIQDEMVFRTYEQLLGLEKEAVAEKKGLTIVVANENYDLGWLADYASTRAAHFRELEEIARGKAGGIGAADLRAMLRDDAALKHLVQPIFGAGANADAIQRISSPIELRKIADELEVLRSTQSRKHRVGSDVISRVRKYAGILERNPGFAESSPENAINLFYQAMTTPSSRVLTAAERRVHTKVVQWEQVAHKFNVWAQNNEADIFVAHRAIQPGYGVASLESMSHTYLGVGITEAREHFAAGDAERALRIFDVIGERAQSVFTGANVNMETEATTLNNYLQRYRGKYITFSRGGEGLTNRIFEVRDPVSIQKEGTERAMSYGLRLYDVANKREVIASPESLHFLGTLLEQAEIVPEAEVETRQQQIAADLVNRRLHRLLGGEVTGEQLEYQLFDIRYRAATASVGDPNAPRQYIEAQLARIDNIMNRLSSTGTEGKEGRIARLAELRRRLTTQLDWATTYGSDVRMQQQFSAASEFVQRDWKLHQQFFKELDALPLSNTARADLISRRFQMLYGEGGVLTERATSSIPVLQHIPYLTPRFPGVKNPTSIITRTQATTERGLSTYIVDAIRKTVGGPTRDSSVYGSEAQKFIAEIVLGQADNTSALFDVSGRLIKDKRAQIIDTLANEMLRKDVALPVGKNRRESLLKGLLLNVIDPEKEDVDELARSVSSAQNPLSALAEIYRSRATTPEVRRRLQAGTTEGLWFVRPVIEDENVAQQVRAADAALLEPLQKASRESRNLRYVAVPDPLNNSTAPLRWYPKSTQRGIDFFEQQDARALINADASEVFTKDMLTRSYLRSFEHESAYFSPVLLEGKTPQQVVDEYGVRGLRALQRLYSHEANPLLHKDITLTGGQRTSIEKLLGWDAEDINAWTVITKRTVEDRPIYAQTTLGELLQGDASPESIIALLGGESNVHPRIAAVLNALRGKEAPTSPVAPFNAATNILANAGAAANAAASTVGGPPKGPPVARTVTRAAVSGALNTGSALGTVAKGTIPPTPTDFVDQLQALVRDRSNIWLLGTGILVTGLLASDVGIKKKRNPYDLEYGEETNMERRGEITNTALDTDPRHYHIVGKIRAKTRSDINQDKIIDAVHSALGIHIGDAEKSHTRSDEREPFAKRAAEHLIKGLLRA